MSYLLACCGPDTKTFVLILDIAPLKFVDTAVTPRFPCFPHLGLFRVGVVTLLFVLFLLESIPDVGLPDVADEVAGSGLVSVMVTPDIAIAIIIKIP